MRAFLAAALFGSLIVAALAQPRPELTAQERRGQALLKRLCASCHAIGFAGASPHREAPSFRTLGRHYKIEALEEPLAEGLIAGHPDMPEFRLSGRQVGEAIAYLKAIQQ